jgi:hypothetical protein
MSSPPVYSSTKRHSYNKYEGVFTDCHSTTVYVIHLLLTIQTLTFVMLSYKYYFNKVTRTASKHAATALSCYRTNITLTQSHVPSVNTKPESSHVII